MENCGAKIAEQAKYCPKCSAVVGEEKKDVGSHAESKKGLSGKKKLLVGGMALALALAGGIMLVVHITSPEYRSGRCVKAAEKYLKEESFQEAITAYMEALEYFPENTAAEEVLEQAYLKAAEALY